MSGKPATLQQSDGLTVGWRQCNAVVPGGIQRPPVDVERLSLAGDFARLCERLVERYSLYAAARESAPVLDYLQHCA